LPETGWGFFGGSAGGAGLIVFPSAFAPAGVGLPALLPCSAAIATAGSVLLALLGRVLLQSPPRVSCAIIFFISLTMAGC
jgi:hypothetical protein